MQLLLTPTVSAPIHESSPVQEASPTTVITPVKPEIEDEETEEETETPLELDDRIDSQSVIPREQKLRKRSRPVSEIEEDQENIRVKLWRMLKTSATKLEEEDPLEPFTLSELSSAPLITIEKVEDLSDNETFMTHHHQLRHSIFRLLNHRSKRQQWHKTKLRKRYKQKYLLWQAHMDKLDIRRQAEMQRLGIQPKPEVAVEPKDPTVAAPGIPSTPGVEVSTPDVIGARGTRRAQQASHARDYVQSEAEFQELMASLGTRRKIPRRRSHRCYRLMNGIRLSLTRMRLSRIL